MENEKKPLAPIMTWFSVIEYPRIERNKLYPLDEIIVITILAVIARAGKTSNDTAERKKPGCGTF